MKWKKQTNKQPRVQSLPHYSHTKYYASVQGSKFATSISSKLQISLHFSRVNRCHLFVIQRPNKFQIPWGLKPCHPLLAKVQTSFKFSGEGSNPTTSLSAKVQTSVKLFCCAGIKVNQWKTIKHYNYFRDRYGKYLPHVKTVQVRKIQKIHLHLSSYKWHIFDNDMH